MVGTLGLLLLPRVRPRRLFSVVVDPMAAEEGSMAQLKLSSVLE
jgi:hypothetical protein